MAIAPSRARTAHRRLALLVASALASGVTSAAIVCSPIRDLDVPQDGEGLYIDFVTGQSARTEGQVPSFDFDPYARQTGNPANQLKFYWGQQSNLGAGVASSGDIYAVLAPGATIGPDSLFTRAGATGDTAAWQAGIDGYLGTRFTNEGAGLLNYGWVRLRTRPPLGFPLTVVQWCYENSGAPITIAERIFCDGFDGTACTPQALMAE